jgi:hypothetical protein
VTIIFSRTLLHGVSWLVTGNIQALASPGIQFTAYCFHHIIELIHLRLRWGGNITYRILVGKLLRMGLAGRDLCLMFILPEILYFKASTALEM